jgi:hypothetical protein
MKTLSMKLLGSCLALALVACGGMEAEPEVANPTPDPEQGNVSAMVTCYAYLLDGANFSGAQLAPFPVMAAPNTCINLPSQSDGLTSSFRLANCGAVFYDYPNCTGPSYAAATSGNMPMWLDNRTTSIRFQ